MTTTSPRRWKWSLAAGLVACALVATGAGAAPGESDLPPPGKVRDLDYGDVLFHFYQDDYFGALVRLEAARDYGRMPNHDADAELLSGGLYLSLGLHAEATRIFNRLLAGSVPQSVSDRARFYLARIGYQRGYYDEAWQSLQKIHGTLPGSLESERRLLSANVLMAQGRYADAASVLSAAGADDDWAAFAQFNLGVALVRSGDVAQGQRWLEAVGTMPAVTEEERSLRDRANLALGYAMLQAREAEPAMTALTRVRLDGPFTNRALLGLGWAESDAKRSDLALVPWLELRERRLLDSAVQESYLAVPYAYAQLAANGQAAEQYRFAVQAYQKEAVRIDESIAAIRSGGFLDSVLAAAPDSDAIGWMWQLQKLPDSPQTRYLYHLLASHEFQEGLKNYRDLRIMQRNLDGWSESLGAFDEMVATRELASSEREPRRTATLAGADLDGFASQQAALEQRVAEIVSRRDVAALATDAEARGWLRLEDIQARIAMLPEGEKREALAERERLLRGVLLWQMDAAYKARLRRVATDLRETGAQLAEARSRVQLVELAGVAAPRDTRTFASRVNELSERVDEIGPRIDAARAAQERVLAAIAVQELEAQKRRLASYATQAQFALAALYDGASAGVLR
jgi:tetratricopeptide (TPR) repeat protein